MKVHIDRKRATKLLKKMVTEIESVKGEDQRMAIAVNRLADIIEQCVSLGPVDAVRNRAGRFVVDCLGLYARR